MRQASADVADRVSVGWFCAPGAQLRRGFGVAGPKPRCALTHGRLTRYEPEVIAAIASRARAACPVAAAATRGQLTRQQVSSQRRLGTGSVGLINGENRAR